MFGAVSYLRLDLARPTPAMAEASAMSARPPSTGSVVPPVTVSPAWFEDAIPLSSEASTRYTPASVSATLAIVYCALSVEYGAGLPFFFQL
jgi:hypothetical protein